jgi:hypothetical protein
VKTWIFLRVLLLAVFLPDTYAAAATSDACTGLVPPALKQKFPDFRLPRQSDYDQNNFFDSEDGGTGCLGVATGSYFGDGVQSYAIILASTAKSHSILVVGRPVSSEWSAYVLRDWGDAPVGRTSVNTLNPGGLQPTETLDGHKREPGEVEQFSSNHQSIATETLASSNVVFFYNYNGKRWVHVRMVL